MRHAEQVQRLTLITISSQGAPLHSRFFLNVHRVGACADDRTHLRTRARVRGGLHGSHRIVRERLHRFIPLAKNASCHSCTKSAPTQSSAEKPLFHTINSPSIMADCVIGKENEKSRSPSTFPPHSFARKVATRSARNPNSSSRGPSLMAFGLRTWRT